MRKIFDDKNSFVFFIKKIIHHLINYYHFYKLFQFSLGNYNNTEVLNYSVDCN